VLIAICALIATTTMSAAFARLVITHKGKARARDSLQREKAYADAFSLPCSRLWACLRNAQFCAGTTAGQESTVTDHAVGGQGGASRRLVAVTIVAILWAVLQSAFIFLLLPRSIDVTLLFALEHTPVDVLVNLGPLTSDHCRTVEFSAGSATRLEPQLIIRRCYTMVVLVPGTGQYSATSSLAEGESAFDMEYLESDGHWRLTVSPTETEFGYQADFVTIAFRPGDLAGTSLSLDARLDAGALEPYFADALIGTSCPLAPLGAQACSTNVGLVYTWVMRCSPAQAAKPEVYAKLLVAFDSAVDLRTSPQQTTEGFARTIVRGHPVQAAAGPRFQALLASVTGATVVARANLLSVAIIMLFAVVVYQAAKVRSPRTATAIALESMPVWAAAARPHDAAMGHRARTWACRASRGACSSS
jgi:hypothetical protein